MPAFALLGDRSMKFLLACALLVAFVLVADSANGQTRYQLVGVAPTGQVAFEYVGIVHQDGVDFEAYGYFTHIRGLPDESLFFDAAKRDEKNARFTFHGRSKMTGRSIVQKVFNVNTKGELVVYVRPRSMEAATMGQGIEFSVGSKVAAFAFRGQSVIAVTSPDQGINTAVLEAKQLKEGRSVFKSGQKDYVFGLPDSLVTFNHVGHGVRSQAEPPIARISIAGRGVSVAESEE